MYVEHGENSGSRKFANGIEARDIVSMGEGEYAPVLRTAILTERPGGCREWLRVHGLSLVGEEGHLCEVKIERGWVVRHMTRRLLGRARG